MAKKKFFGTLILLAGVFTLFTACGQEGDGTAVNNDNTAARDDLSGYGNHEGLSAETERRIVQDFHAAYCSDFPDITIDKIFMEEYLGTYDGCVAFTIGGPFHYPSGGWDLIIADTLFSYGSGPPIEVWKEGRFYGLREAYDSGLLTRENMRDIAYICYGGRERNLENHAGLPRDVASDIELTYFFAYIEPYYPDAYGGYESIEKYYGYYRLIDRYGNGDLSNDCFAVMVTNNRYIVHDDAAWETTVAGVPFRYDNGNRILLWRHPTLEEMAPGVRGYFHELQEAYDSGLLTLEDVRSIAYYHENGKALSGPFYGPVWARMGPY